MDTFLSLCQHRRSIRKYTSQPVEQEKIDYLLRCALMSPSSKRTSPWEFIVIRDEETGREIRAVTNFSAPDVNMILKGGKINSIKG